MQVWKTILIPSLAFELLKPIIDVRETLQWRHSSEQLRLAVDITISPHTAAQLPIAVRHITCYYHCSIRKWPKKASYRFYSVTLPGSKIVLSLIHYLLHRPHSAADIHSCSEENVSFNVVIIEWDNLMGNLFSYVLFYSTTPFFPKIILFHIPMFHHPVKTNRMFSMYTWSFRNVSFIQYWTPWVSTISITTGKYTLYVEVEGINIIYKVEVVIPHYKHTPLQIKLHLKFRCSGNKEYLKF